MGRGDGRGCGSDDEVDLKHRDPSHLNPQVLVRYTPQCISLLNAADDCNSCGKGWESQISIGTTCFLFDVI